MAKKKKKQTKTATEFQKIKKRIREQERYYQKRGFDTTSVQDIFAGVKPTRKSLSELRKYEKVFKSSISELKKKVKALKKEKGISAEVAYKYLSAFERARSDQDVLAFEDVIFKAFGERISKMPNYESRKKMAEFVGRLRSLIGDSEAAAILAETASNEVDFEAVLQYEENSTALYNTYQLMETIVEKLDESQYPITVMELREFMDTLEF